MPDSTQHGLRMSLKAAGTQNLPNIVAELTNVSILKMTLCIYKIRHRILTTMWTDTGFEIFPFRPTPRNPLRADDYKALSPGESLLLKLDLNEAWSEGYRFCKNSSLPPKLDEGLGLKALPPGEHIVKAHLGVSISFFSAEPGFYNHKRERLSLIDLSKENSAASPPSDLWKGDLTPSCEVIV